MDEGSSSYAYLPTLSFLTLFQFRVPLVLKRELIVSKSIKFLLVFNSHNCPLGATLKPAKPIFSSLTSCHGLGSMRSMPAELDNNKKSNN